ncbi:MAG: hypothetical protein AB1456_04360, partial [Thermodesulfobacteriota bacterium]
PPAAAPAMAPGMMGGMGMMGQGGMMGGMKGGMKGGGMGSGMGMMGGQGGMGMMGGGMGCGMMGGGMGMGQGVLDELGPEEQQKFLDATRELRKSLHDKQFEYAEVARDSKASRQELLKKRKEVWDIQQKLHEKAWEFLK